MQRARAAGPEKPKLNFWYDKITNIPDPGWREYWDSALTYASAHDVRGRAKRAKFTCFSEAQVTIEMEAYDEGAGGPYTIFRVTYRGTVPGSYQFVGRDIPALPPPRR